MPVTFSEFAQGVRDETAFAVLAIAKRLKAEGKNVIELEIGDSPFPSTPAAKQAGHDAITNDQTHYAPSLGIPDLRRAAADYVRREHGIDAKPENVVVGPGAKVFELLFCEAFINPGDDALIFSPYFPTYIPNIQRRGAEPYDQMVWQGKHHSPLVQPGMMDQCVAAYTFSKSYSMSGWRAGFAVSSKQIIDRMGLLLNTSLSCVSPIVQLAAAAALDNDEKPRGEQMRAFRDKLFMLIAGLNTIPGFKCLEPRSTFYAFPNVAEVCNRLQITSHGLALYFLEGADEKFGVACLGGECFGPAGGGFLRFSCAEPDDKLQAAVAFVKQAITQTDKVAAYVAAHPEHKLATPYAT